MKELKYNCDQCKKTLYREELDKQVEPIISLNNNVTYLTISSMKIDSCNNRDKPLHFCNHKCSYQWLSKNFYHGNDPYQDEINKLKKEKECKYNQIKKLKK